MTTAVPIYRAIMLEIEQRRQSLGLPQEKFSEYAGLPDRYYPKALFADTASGRQASWGSLQLIVDALFPHGFDVEIRAKPGNVIDAGNLKAKLLRLQATKDPKTQRELMRALGRRGGVKSGQTRRHRSEQRARRRALASHAARMRWSAQDDPTKYRKSHQ